MPSTEEERQAYANMHHLTEMPDSIKEHKMKSFSLKALEETLQDKIAQFVSKDSDRVRQILRLFKSQADRTGQEDAARLGINKATFYSVLIVLKLFATREQSDQLFDYYDVNGDGMITAHDLLTRNRPRDYSAEVMGDRGTASLYLSDGKGKKQYLRTRLLNQSVRSKTPVDSVFHLTMDRIAHRLREKLMGMKSVGDTHSTARARLQLAHMFEYYDTMGDGTVDAPSLQQVLDRTNFPLAEAHKNMLLRSFCMSNSRFNYRAFVSWVYPDERNVSTSLQLNYDHGREMLDKLERTGFIPPAERDYLPLRPHWGGSHGGGGTMTPPPFAQFSVPRPPSRGIAGLSGSLTARPPSRAPAMIPPSSGSMTPRAYTQRAPSRVWAQPPPQFYGPNAVPPRTHSRLHSDSTLYSMRTLTPQTIEFAR